MENKIVPGPFVDKLISDYLKIPKKKYSTIASSAMSLLARYANATPCHFSINFNKQLNTQNCEVTLSNGRNNYHAKDGYLPMTICLLFINSWCEGLKNYSFEFFKMKWEKAKHIKIVLEKYDIHELATEKDEELEQFYHDFEHLFNNLNDTQIKALINYAK